ncbi:DUF418 domain-containing protein [Corynebacterium fournieri]|uniref:DUF418 domain-containing protein n=1 Tax=Corynebacterium fournieri TaxID=1852390 RepID=UPI000A2F6A41|nr:DUF418 domain-containing protein [Corynebacterium fournieri]WJY97011.1 hypothetical protein CFOUR_02870 [Corynebacterium fournieri]
MHDSRQHTATQPRLIVPDLARGTALLGIAMANVAQAWIINDWSEDQSRVGWSVGGVRPDSVLDQFGAVFAAMFIHVRGLPMFSTLLGFGFGLVAASLYRKHYPAKQARRVLWRRYGFLALFGLAHSFLLFYGDIMLTYGLVGIALAAMLTLSSKTLRIIAYIILGLFTAFGTFGAVASVYFDATEGFIESDPTITLDTPAAYFSSNFSMAVGMLGLQPFAALQLLALALIGYVWARERVLVDVAAHRRTLTTWTVITGLIVLCVGLPWGLAAAGVLPAEWEMPFFVLNQAVGYLTGPGILAALALATDRLHNEVPGWARAFVALGKRSMSGYLAQSVLFILLCTPAFLGIGLEASVTGKLLIGFAVWAISLLLAVALERAGKQGPFEWAHRHLSYGKTGRIEPKYDQPQVTA